MSEFAENADYEDDDKIYESREITTPPNLEHNNV